MNPPKNIPTTLIATVVVIAIGIIAAQFFKNDNEGVTVSVKVPQLSAQATVGKVAFDAAPSVTARTAVAPSRVRRL